MDDPAPSPLPADRRYECLRCAFSLTGLIPFDGRLTCPECGLTGSLAEVAEPEPPRPPAPLRLLWRMIRWSAALLLLTVALSVLAEYTAPEFGTLAVFAAVAALLAGFLTPLLAAGDYGEVYLRRRDRGWKLVSTAASGIALNFTLALLLLIAYGVIGLLNE